MALYLTEGDVAALLSMDEAIQAVEGAFRAKANERACNLPRQRIVFDSRQFNVMGAALTEPPVCAVRSFVVSDGQARPVCLLFAGTGEMLAVLEAGLLGRMRTGAASAVAAKYLSRTDSNTIGLIGTGGEARTQLTGLVVVRPIKKAVVFGRDREKLARFCREIEEALPIALEKAITLREASEAADILVTATSAAQPVTNREWLRPGTHVNAVGAIQRDHRELDAATLLESQVIVVDDKEQARLECGDVLALVEAGNLTWDRVRSLDEVVVEKVGRGAEADLTVFSSQGVAVEDVAVAWEVYAKAREQGRGRELALSPSAAGVPFVDGGARPRLFPELERKGG